MEDGDFRRRPPLWTSYFSPEEVCFLTTVHTLASGSSGNALLLSCGESYILLDAGISCRRITAALRELGELLYATHTGTLTESEVLLAKLQEIDGLRQQIDRLEWEIARLQGGAVCPFCGAAARSGDVFCRECGQKL